MGQIGGQNEAGPLNMSVEDPATGLPVGEPLDTAHARRPDRSTALEGAHVRLVPVDPAAHGEALYANAHGPERDALWLYLFPPPFADLPSFQAYLERSAASSDPFMYAILDRQTGEPVGHATYMRIEPGHRVIEVGNILYTPKLQRSTGATEAMYLMARHAFETLGYRRYEWKCNALNAPSRRAALRYGFTYEGTFRQHMIVKGHSRDTAWFAMMAEDWPARKRAFERWLAPANFDETGRPKTSLAELNRPTLTAGSHTLRRAVASDAPALAALMARSWAENQAILGVEPIPLMTPAVDIIASYETWLVGDPDGLAGALVLELRNDDLLIWNVSVDSDRQGAGLGRSLLAAAESRAADLGYGRIRLYTGEKLTRNVEWYARNGYAIERTERMSDRTAVHMIKDLRIREDQDDGTARG